MSYAALVSVNNATYGGVYYCANFTLTGAQPTWAKLTTTGLPSLLLEYFRVDYGDPIYRQYCKIGNGVYGRNGGDWSLLMDLATAAALCGKSATNATIESLWSDPTIPGRVYTGFMTDPEAPYNSAEIWVLKSSDYGATWSAHQVVTGRSGFGEVVAIGESIWVSATKVLLASSNLYYSEDGGTSFVAYTGFGGFGDSYLVILPHSPNTVWVSQPGTNIMVTRSGGAWSTRTPSIGFADRTDGATFKLDGSYGITIDVLGNYYYSTDDFVSHTTVSANDGVQTPTFPSNDLSATCVAFGYDSSGMIDVVDNLGDTTLSDRSGTNTSTSPYTSAIPNCAETSIYGIWFGYPPADKGIFVYSVEEDEINTMPDVDGLGMPMFGDRSAWRVKGDDGLVIASNLREYHAEDVWDAEPIIHNPWPAISGQVPVSDGSKWVAGDVPGAHDPVTLDVDAAVILDLTGQEIGLDVQTANTVLAGPTTGAANEPTFRALVAADLPIVSRVTNTITAGITTLDTTYDVVLCNAAAGAITVNLPAVATNTGRAYTIKKIDSSANAVTIDGNASELIDGVTTQTINYQWTSATIVCDGAAWYIV